jgi:hypothetical protein
MSAPGDYNKLMDCIQSDICGAEQRFLLIFLEKEGFGCPIRFCKAEQHFLLLFLEKEDCGSPNYTSVM